MRLRIISQIITILSRSRELFACAFASLFGEGSRTALNVEAEQVEMFDSNATTKCSDWKFNCVIQFYVTQPQLKSIWKSFGVRKHTSFVYYHVKNLSAFGKWKAHSLEINKRSPSDNGFDSMKLRNLTPRQNFGKTLFTAFTWFRVFFHRKLFWPPQHVSSRVCLRLVKKLFKSFH